MMCDEGMEKTVQHLVLYCKRYEIERRERLDVIMRERGMDNWKDLQLFWSESWMMKYMLGLGRRYGPPKRVSMESVKDCGEHSNNKAGNKETSGSW